MHYYRLDRSSAVDFPFFHKLFKHQRDICECCRSKDKDV